MRRQKVVIAVVVGSMTLTGLVLGQSAKGNVVMGLLSKDPLARQAAFNEVVRERTATIEKLLTVLEADGVDGSYQGPLHRAIVLLGALRAGEAVEPLTKLLVYVPEGFEAEEQIPTEAYCVATVALTKIGCPAIEAMLRKIRTSHDDRERRLAAWVVMQIDGKEQAAHRIDVLMQSQQGEQRARVSAAAIYIRDYQPRFEPPTWAGHD